MAGIYAHKALVKSLAELTLAYLKSQSKTLKMFDQSLADFLSSLEHHTQAGLTSALIFMDLLEGDFH